jgi:molybdate transport system substrate-binding protein
VRLNAFADLASPAVKRIAITNSKTSPAGRYALEALAYYRIADATKSKLILAENVRQVMDYIVRGEVDAGIVFASDATTRSRDSVIAATASPASHDSILYPVAIIKGSAQSQAAVAFITTLLSPDGQMILIKHGLAGMK